ncbi:two-component system, response regulator YesN [Caloranaerobacter azorensis DSM 13643]|uniref:Two-component system, response regulator YesN n=1 Tax=Caloranaerobacter azorensis DSM 13643 TaxID=1121264 RepID=A0A1M5TJD6_9FIRM|nr:response regulator [Caloranaerobacter azorensis]SHH50809.1 two-component system, response regulator YesN [Caloranaerobacter azorensis DSM 13643]
MYRLLIADDEPIEREGLKLIINKNLPDIRVIGEAKNGREAIELVDELSPDILLLDIKMPGINGIEAAKEIRRKYKNLKIIILSAYDYFAYAKESFSLGVYDYLLKPVRRAKLIETLEKVISEIEKERIERQEKLKLREELSDIKNMFEEKFVTIILEDGLKGENNIKNRIDILDMTFDLYYVLAISIESKNNDMLSNIYDEVFRYFKHREKSIISKYNDNIYVLVEVDNINEIEVKRLSYERANKIYNRLIGKYDIDIRIGVKIGRGIDNLKRVIIEANKLIISVKNKNIISDFYDKNEEDLIEIKEEYQKILSIIKGIVNGDRESLIELYNLLEMLCISENYKIIKLYEIISILRFLIFKKRGKMYFNDLLSGSKNLELDLCYVKKIVIDELNKYFVEINNQTHEIIERAKEYIYKNYNKDIKLEDVAEKVSVSPYYFSKLFKKEMGKNFIDFLTELRIEEAKKKLDEGMSIKAVSRCIGYSDPNYFSRVFKKITGMSPNSYKKILKK